MSEIYAAEGQKGLDREVIRMLYEYAELRGSHTRAAVQLCDKLVLCSHRLTPPYRSKSLFFCFLSYSPHHGSRPVPIWQMDKRYEQPVMERLADRFGGTEGGDLADFLTVPSANLGNGGSVWALGID